MSADIDALRELSRQIDALYISGKETEGEVLLRQAIDRAKDIEPAYRLFLEGELAGYTEKNHERQRHLFEQAIELLPEDSFLVRNMGVALSFLGRMDEAISSTRTTWASSGRYG